MKINKSLSRLLGICILLAGWSTVKAQIYLPSTICVNSPSYSTNPCPYIVCYALDIYNTCTGSTYSTIAKCDTVWPGESVCLHIPVSPFCEQILKRYVFVTPLGGNTASTELPPASQYLETRCPSSGTNCTYFIRQTGTNPETYSIYQDCTSGTGG